MMILNGDEIIDYHNRGLIKVDPWDEKAVGVNSYDVRLGGNLTIYTETWLDPKKQNKTRKEKISPDGYALKAGDFVLGHTLEYNENLADDLVPMFEGRSSVARLGLSAHLSAGFGDICFCGHWTLEIVAAHNITIYPGMPIGQLFWIRTTKSNRHYIGKYLGQRGAVASRLYLERQFGEKSDLPTL
jgi:dCTP deaminase